MIAADMTARISSPVFVGRALELATLEAALEKAEGRSAGIVLIAGEAGIGKSRLVAELAGQARDRGGVVLEGGCISLASDEGLPFGPIAEALRGLVRRTEPEALQDLLDPGMGELARLVPELTARSAGASLASPPEWAQTRLFEGFLSTSCATPIASSTDRITRTRRSGSAMDSARSRTETSLPSSLAM